MWVLIVMSWVTAGNVGGGFNVSSVPNFTTKQTCENAATVIKTKHEQNIQTACVQQ